MDICNHWIGQEVGNKKIILEYTSSANVVTELKAAKRSHRKARQATEVMESHGHEATLSMNSWLSGQTYCIDSKYDQA